MASNRKKAAHFLLLGELAGSPPNEALIGALLDLGFDVDLYAPGGGTVKGLYDSRVTMFPVEYGKRWLLRNALSRRWREYQIFSGTSEDPLGVAGALARLHRKPFTALADEIKSGSYYGDAPESWKRLCRWAMRGAAFNIVNDESRVQLQREYAGISPDSPVLVYPGCFRQPPAPSDRASLREKWGIPMGALTIGVSGGFNETSGADWLFKVFSRDPSIHLVIQALNMPPFTRMLLENTAGAGRLYLEPNRLSWQDAWASASACDIGLAIYTNPAPQFQHMGISSNRLCMYLAMGVPVIANRQPSFEFLEHFDCGRMVSSEQEFSAAVEKIRDCLPAMRANALTCAREYIRAPQRWLELREKLSQVTQDRAGR